MQVAVAGTGARAVDGSTNVLPVGDREHVHAAWRLHAGLVRRALERGFYQGWDLHPAQLVTRYAATYAFFRAALPAAAARLAAYLDRTDGRRPRRAGHRPGAGRGRSLRGLDCGAVDDDESSRRGGPGPRRSWISWRAGGQGDPEGSPIVARPAAARRRGPAREGT